MPISKHRLMPKMRVYFPQYVTIHNPRLAALYWLIVLGTMSIAAYNFIGERRYELKKLPEGEVAMCSILCPPIKPDPTKSPYCNSPASFGPLYQDIKCAPLCSTNSSGICLSSADMVQYSPSTAFIPTFYRESILHNPTGIVSGGHCNASHLNASANGQVCSQIRNYWVPGVESQTHEFTHQFVVEQPVSSIWPNLPDMTGSSLTGLPTVLLKPDGSMMKMFKPGERIKFTVQTLLEYAGIDETGPIGSNDNSDMVGLDLAYQRQGWVDVAATPRLTGLQVTFDIFYTNEGYCQLTLEHSPVYPGGSYPELACLLIRARRQWSQVEKTDQWNLDGSSVTRTYHGILIDYHIRGSFKFLDFHQVFKGVTTLLIWLQIPIWLLYFFCIFCLGGLSKIYERVIHQEMSLSGACLGLGARLISHTSAFADVKDTPLGLTKKRLLERIKMIMQYNTALDDNEIQHFTDFVYEGVAVASVTEPATAIEVMENAQLIDLQDFVRVCSSNESLSFDALVEIFDADRRLSIVENVFQDDCMRQARSSAANEEMKDRVNNAMVNTGSLDRHINRSAGISGHYTADVLQTRCNNMESEILQIQKECNDLVEKQQSLVRTILYTEEKLKKLGESPDAPALSPMSSEGS